jgi:hypothetical protein
VTPGDLARPAHVRHDGDFAAWFDLLAERLLNGTDLLVAHQRLRIAETEFYYYGPLHPDPFAHRDPVQVHAGRWYFHRTGGALRGGSYKGLDLTFGEPGVYAGALIRSLVRPDGALVNGPSKCVDLLLELTGHAKVAELDAALGTRRAWDAPSPLRMVAANRDDRRYATARVGLSLKRAVPNPSMPFYLLRPYRHLTEPRRIAKGKMHLVLALHAKGVSADEIRAVTGCTLHTFDRVASDFARGRSGLDLADHFGAALRTATLARLHGWWSTR